MQLFGGRRRDAVVSGCKARGGGDVSCYCFKLQQGVKKRVGSFRCCILLVGKGRVLLVLPVRDAGDGGCGSPVFHRLAVVVFEVEGAAVKAGRRQW